MLDHDLETRILCVPLLFLQFLFSSRLFKRGRGETEQEMLDHELETNEMVTQKTKSRITFHAIKCTGEPGGARKRRIYLQRICCSALHLHSSQFANPCKGL